MLTVRIKYKNRYVTLHYDDVHEAYVAYNVASAKYDYVDCFIGYCRVLWTKDYNEYEPLADL